MGRLGITKEDVFTACRALMERGEPVTQENVRNELKTGSYTTVWRHVRDFKAQEQAKTQVETKPDRAPIPESLQVDATQLVQSLWQKAWTEAEAELKTLKQERDTLKAQLDEKSNDFDQLFSEAQVLEEKLESQRKELDAAKASTLKCAGEVETLKTDAAARSQEIKSLLERAVTAEQALEKRNREYNESFSDSERLKAKLQSIEAELIQAQKTLSIQGAELSAVKEKNVQYDREFRGLLERAISAEKELSFLKAQVKPS